MSDVINYHKNSPGISNEAKATRDFLSVLGDGMLDAMKLPKRLFEAGAMTAGEVRAALIGASDEQEELEGMPSWEEFVESCK